MTAAVVGTNQPLITEDRGQPRRLIVPETAMPDMVILFEYALEPVVERLNLPAAERVEPAAFLAFVQRYSLTPALARCILGRGRVFASALCRPSAPATRVLGADEAAAGAATIVVVLNRVTLGVVVIAAVRQDVLRLHGQRLDLGPGGHLLTDAGRVSGSQHWKDG